MSTSKSSNSAGRRIGICATPGGPNGLNENAPKMTVAAAVFRWNQSGIGHQLVRLAEAIDVANLAHNRRGGNS
jgi:hypothetical protein